MVRIKGKEMGKLTHLRYDVSMWKDHTTWVPEWAIFRFSLSICPCQPSLLMVWLWRPEMWLQQGDLHTEGARGQWHPFAFSYWWEESVLGHSCSWPVSLLNNFGFYLGSFQIICGHGFYQPVAELGCQGYWTLPVYQGYFVSLLYIWYIMNI